MQKKEIFFTTARVEKPWYKRRVTGAEKKIEETLGKPYNRATKTEEAAPRGTQKTEAKILKTRRTPISATEILCFWVMFIVSSLFLFNLTME